MDKLLITSEANLIKEVVGEYCIIEKKIPKKKFDLDEFDQWIDNQTTDIVTVSQDWRKSKATLLLNFGEGGKVKDCKINKKDRLLDMMLKVFKEMGIG